jgi:thioesterase domain-containing protein
MSIVTNTAWAQRLQAEFDRSIPLTRAMGIRVEYYDGQRLELRAPLAPNVNDKGTAFGGSISSMLTLVGWGVIWIECGRADIDCDVVIHKGNISYNKPVYGELCAVCRAPGADELEQFLERLQKKGRARLQLQSELLSESDIMALFDCQYAALLARDSL